ncbi:tyrosine-type recombinase/integrase [Acidipropionibacterium jensenii]|uniref:tyrosine-type recombinase/integrase n=1 Tax=Acidipropionibacterium jensenii TaxID=1749 RepID=UPI00264A309F|nr:site-specific integrase [Acidipropionibacterium jensenii]MDN5976907.1 site-specific integrase [Acidipropionibacterium jensenii]MDN5995868.1 site-specific integrase [Acidipropionibacterium jensenii]MDN6426290.1 site-specific integrase [Acidipropionibacterium jensenii]MDN6441021.1 site-specific integrase [Acidipropionibacterium jensenii]MDN6480211.1 site-specific integrase [Acidipropionibacterium jensenii]
MTSGNWQARYIGPDHHRHQAPSTFVDRGYAEGWLSEERKLISQGLWTPPIQRYAEQVAAEEREAAMPTVLEWIGTVIERRATRARRPLRQTTVDLYRKDARLRIAGTRLGDLRLDTVTRADVAAWWDHLDRSTPTQNSRAYQLLSSVMKDAVDDELIETSPCHLKGAGKPSPQHSAATVEALTPAQTLAYMRAVPEHYRVALMVGIWCGLRSGEIRGLRRRDVDLGAKVFHVEQAVSRVRIGDHHWDWHYGDTKTDAGWRAVAMPAQLVRPMRTWLAGLPVRGRDALVFPASDGVHPLASSVLWEAHHKGCEVIDRPELTVHDLRRTAATLAAQDGATTAELMRMLGHTTAAMAMHYQMTSTNRDRERADRLSRTLRQAEKRGRHEADGSSTARP